MIVDYTPNLRALAAGILTPRELPDIVAFLEGRTTDRDGNAVPPLQLIDKDDPYRGPFTTENCPDIREILRSCVSRTTRRTVIVGPTQSFKTTILIGVEAYTIAVDHGPIGHVLPNAVPLASAFSQKRFQPIVDNTPWLRALKPSNPDEYKTLELGFTTCTLRFAGANSPGNLASWPYRRVIGDETDKFPQLIKNESGTRELLLQRTGQFAHWNGIDASSPTVPWGTIWQAALVGTCERFYVPCPHPTCGKPFTHRFTTDGSTLTWDPASKHANGTWDIERVGRTAHYRCPHCGNEVWENHRRAMLHAAAEPGAERHGLGWIPDPKDVADAARADYDLVADPDCRSFFRSCFNVLHPNRTYAAIAKKFLLAGRDRSKLQNFWNSELGEVWQETGEAADADVLYKRREDYLDPATAHHPDFPGRLVLPEEVRTLTASADIQAEPARVEFEILGWGAGFESWGLHYGVIEKRGRTWQETFAEVDAYFLRTWLLPIAHGGYMELQPAAICWDTGHETEEVYKFVRACQPRRVYAVKGDSEGYGSPLVHRAKKSGVKQVPLHMIGTVTAKLEIVSRLRLTEPGPGMCHFPKNPKCGYDMEYFRQLTAEKAMRRRMGGRDVYKFVPIRKRNEALDIRCYNRAALHLLDPNFEKIEAKIQTATAQLELPTPAPTNETESSANHNGDQGSLRDREGLRSDDGNGPVAHPHDDHGLVPDEVREVSLDQPITKAALSAPASEISNPQISNPPPPDAPQPAPVLLPRAGEPPRREVEKPQTQNPEPKTAPAPSRPNTYEVIAPNSKPQTPNAKPIRPARVPRRSWATRW